MEKTKQRYFKNKVKQCAKLNARQWWKEVKGLAGMNSSTQVSSILSSERLLEGVVDLANHMYINNCFIQATTNMRELRERPTITEDATDKYRVSMEEVKVELSRVSQCKATGPNNFPSWILNNASDILSLSLCSIFTPIDEAYLLTIWKSADVIPSLN